MFKRLFLMSMHCFDVHYVSGYGVMSNLCCPDIVLAGFCVIDPKCLLRLDFCMLRWIEFRPERSVIRFSQMIAAIRLFGDEHPRHMPMIRTAARKINVVGLLLEFSGWV